MAFKKNLALSVLLFSAGVHAIPPSPPSAIYNKIRTIAARNCVTENNIRVSELKNTDFVTFVLQLNKKGSSGILIMMENGSAVESFEVTCNKRHVKDL